MIALIASFSVKEDKIAEFEEVAKTLVEKTHTEPGNKTYRLHKSADGKTYTFYELYENEAAIAAHTASEHFKKAFPIFQQCLAGPPKLERLQVVAG